MHVQHQTVVLVADGRKLLFYRNHGDAQHPDLKIEVAEEDGHGADHFHQMEEDQFAVAAADLLKRRALAHEFKHLIIVAAPRTLGGIRKHLHAEVERRIAGELAKDLTGHSVSDIEAALVAA